MTKLAPNSRYNSSNQMINIRIFGSNNSRDVFIASRKKIIHYHADIEADSINSCAGNYWEKQEISFLKHKDPSNTVNIELFEKDAKSIQEDIESIKEKAHIRYTRTVSENHCNNFTHSLEEFNSRFFTSTPDHFINNALNKVNLSPIVFGYKHDSWTPGQTSYFAFFLVPFIADLILGSAASVILSIVTCCVIKPSFCPVAQYLFFQPDANEQSPLLGCACIR